VATGDLSVVDARQQRVDGVTQDHINLPDYMLVAHNEKHAAQLREWFPGMQVIINAPLNEFITDEKRRNRRS
jgi:hypothetical protein